MAKKIIFILGGARSGKSRYALESTRKLGKKVAFLAACQPLDDEMKKRIARHKEERPKNWSTFEEPLEIAAVIEKIGDKFDVILFDCLTLWISNCMLTGHGQKKIEANMKRMINAARNKSAHIVFVSNEVGLGIVPENKLARDFRDIAGRVNQIAARYADEVVYMAAGIPMKIK